MAKKEKFKITSTVGNEKADLDRFYDLIAKIILETEEEEKQKK